MEAQKTGKLINYLRTKKGLTQKELAQQINVSDKAVSKWERGDGCPDVAILPNLAAVLETDVDSILNGEIKRRELTEEEVQKMLAEANKQNGWDKINKQFLKNAFKYFMINLFFIVGAVISAFLTNIFGEFSVMFCVGGLLAVFLLMFKKPFGSDIH